MSLRAWTIGTASALALVLAVGCPGDDDGGTGTDDSDDGVNVSAVYSTNCAGCHGADGGGVSGFPDLNTVVPGLSETDVEAVIRSGQGQMPAFTASQIDDEELGALSAWIVAEYGD